MKDSFNHLVRKYYKISMSLLYKGLENPTLDFLKGVVILCDVPHGNQIVTKIHSSALDSDTPYLFIYILLRNSSR